MSILVAVTSTVPATAPSTAPTTAAAAAVATDAVTAQNLLVAAGMIAWALAVAMLLGSFRRSSVTGDPRLAPGTKPISVFLVLIGGFVVWFGLQIAYMSVRAIEYHQSGADAPFNASALSPSDFGFLSTIPYIAGLLALMFGDRLARRSLPRELGWSIDRLPMGLAIGALAMVSVMPLMSGASIVLEWLYQSVGFKHPTEHELLTVLGKSTDPLARWLIIGGATLLAPVFEEFLFRGHLQTILARAFTPRPRRLLDFTVMPPEAIAATAGNAALATPPPVFLTVTPPAPEPPPLVVPPPGARWLAIVVTSLLFAVLHPGWTWPLIFLLSITLGYAYERTANLWVPVTMHLIFNTLQTTLFLYMRSL